MISFHLQALVSQNIPCPYCTLSSAFSTLSSILYSSNLSSLQTRVPGLLSHAGRAHGNGIQHIQSMLIPPPMPVEDIGGKLSSSKAGTDGENSMRTDKNTWQTLEADGLALIPCAAQMPHSICQTVHWSSKLTKTYLTFRMSEHTLILIFEMKMPLSFTVVVFILYLWSNMNTFYKINAKMTNLDIFEHRMNRAIGKCLNF